ncbi:hypothetical protein SESBI_51027 [Sesbania bispinosa]|nr:hypothetical protein SESBI_51027 [Sesbania bispinosa]
MKKNLSTANTFHLEKILQQSVQDRRTLQCNLGPTKYEETLSLNQGSLGCNQEAHLMPLDTNKSAIRPPKLVQKNDTREAKLKDEIQHDKVDMTRMKFNMTRLKFNLRMMSFPSLSSTSSKSSRKWRLKDFLLFCIASAGRGSSKDPFKKYSVLYKKLEEGKGSTVRSSDNTRSRRKEQVSAHELHYARKKTEIEGLKKRTFLPYKQGILGQNASQLRKQSASQHARSRTKTTTADDEGSGSGSGFNPFRSDQVNGNVSGVESVAGDCDDGSWNCHRGSGSEGFVFCARKCDSDSEFARDLNSSVQGTGKGTTKKGMEFRKNGGVEFNDT